MHKLSDLAIRALLRLKSWLRERSAVKRVLHEKWSRETFSNYYIHEIMLADGVRNDAYRRAIEKYVRSDHVVLDVGTGTGLLALLASRRNPKKIYAIDHAEIIETAKRVARANNRDDIEFLKVHSRDFNPPDKVDVILHEQIGYYLFDERFVENLTQLRDRVLARGGKIIPARFDLFIEPMTLKDEYRIPFLWQLDVHGVRFDALTDSDMDWNRFRADGRISSYMQQRVWPYQVKHLLAEPQKLFSIDLETIKPADVPTRLRYTRTVACPGRLDLFGIYFRANFDDEIFFDTSPRSPRTHFENVCVRLEGLDVYPGDVIDVEWTFGDIAVIDTWSLKYRINSAQRAAQPLETATEG